MEQNVRIDKEIHAIAAEFCSKEGHKLGKYATKAIREKLIRDGAIKNNIEVGDSGFKLTMDRSNRHYNQKF